MLLPGGGVRVQKHAQPSISSADKGVDSSPSTMQVSDRSSGADINGQNDCPVTGNAFTKGTNEQDTGSQMPRCMEFGSCAAYS